MKTIDKVNQLEKIFVKAYDLKRGGLLYGLSDLSDWLETELEVGMYLISDLKNELEAEPF